MSDQANEFRELIEKKEVNWSLWIGVTAFIAIILAILTLVNSTNVKRLTSEHSAWVDSSFVKTSQQIADLRKVVTDDKRKTNSSLATQNNQLVKLENGAQVTTSEMIILKGFGIEYFPAIEIMDSTGEVIDHRWLATSKDSAGNITYMYAGKKVPDSAVVMIPQNKVKWSQKTANRSLYLGFRLIGYSAQQADSLYKAVLVKFDTKVIEDALANAPGVATQTATIDSQTIQTIAVLERTVAGLTAQLDQLKNDWTKNKRVQEQYNRIVREEHKSKYAKYFKVKK